MEPKRSCIRVLAAFGLALGTACVRLPVTVPPPTAMPTVFSVADYRHLGPVERQDLLARVKAGRPIATDADLVTEYA